jgi:RNA 3'-terminal phosphate cyclase
MAKANSSVTTTRVTEHLLTNLWVISHFLRVKVQRWGEIGGPGRVEFLNE